MTLRLVGKGSLRPSKVKSGRRHEMVVFTRPKSSGSFGRRSAT